MIAALILAAMPVVLAPMLLALTIAAAAGLPALIDADDRPLPDDVTTAVIFAVHGWV